MDNKQEFWDIPISPEEEQDIDKELFKELNKIDFENIEKHNDNKLQKSKISSYLKKIIVFIIISIFIVFLVNIWLKIFSLPDFSFLNISNELKKNSYYDNLQKSVVSINSDSKSGTGFNINSNGIIVTNNHVINNSKQIKVLFNNGNYYNGKVIKQFPEIDLALIDIDANNLPTVKVEKKMNYYQGKKVTIIGNPLGIENVIQKGIMKGFVKLQGWNEPVIMIEGYIHPGNSGSPVFNNNGNVEAVIFGTLTKKNTESDKNTGLAVPIDYILEKL